MHFEIPLMQELGQKAAQGMKAEFDKLASERDAAMARAEKADAQLAILAKELGSANKKFSTIT